jgi:hypothetical protein
MASNTHIITALMGHHPKVFGGGLTGNWKQVWMLIQQNLPRAFTDKEEWFYIHYATGSCQMGTTREVTQEFTRFLRTGLVEHPGDTENDKGFYTLFKHPTDKSKMVRADFTFRRFAHPKKQNPVCPILWGLGIMAEGMTYMNTKFTVVDKDEGHKAFEVAPNPENGGALGKLEEVKKDDE